jgi:hypothetical protein
VLQLASVERLHFARCALAGGKMAAVAASRQV